MLATLRALVFGTLVVLAALAGIGWWLAPPTSRLLTDLPARGPTPAGPQVLRLEDGASFEGSGRFRIGDELIEIRRCDAEGRPVALGPLVAENPDTFRVVERGAAGTQIAAHARGTDVSPDRGWFLPRAEGPFAGDVDGLFSLILWVTGLVFLGTEAVLLAAVWLASGKRATAGRPVHGRLGLEATWTLIAGLILAWLAFSQQATWEHMKDPARFPDPGPEDASFEDRFDWEGPQGADGQPTRRPVRVQVLALRYQWAFRLAGRDGQFATADDVTTSVLTVPAGRDVLFTLRSMDVIHGFFMPHFRLKQDVVPGLAIPGWFRADTPGRYPILCSELCGANHTYMAGEMRVMKTEEWRDWLEDTSTEAVLEHLGADPLEDGFTEDDLDPLPREEWYGAGMGKLWAWWDANPVPVGYDRTGLGDTPR